MRNLTVSILFALVAGACADATTTPVQGRGPGDGGGAADATLAGASSDDASDAARGVSVDAAACPCIGGTTPDPTCGIRRNDAGACLNCCHEDVCGLAPDPDGTCLGPSSVPGGIG